jgi:hypothetical protein
MEPNVCLRTVQKGVAGEDMGRAFGSMAAAERLKRYRELAAEALKKAEQDQDCNARLAHITMAAAWHELADEMERSSFRASDLGPLTPHKQQ